MRAFVCVLCILCMCATLFYSSVYIMRTFGIHTYKAFYCYYYLILRLKNEFKHS